LVDILEPIEAKINLIQFNPHDGTQFRRSPIEQVLAFRSVVIRGGRVCTIRDSRGDDELAACGQLGDVARAARGAPKGPLPPPERFLAALAGGGGGGSGCGGGGGAAAGAGGEGIDD
jgi:23S rRNA (adenine2503-C2)-methyltransferase